MRILKLLPPPPTPSLSRRLLTRNTRDFQFQQTPNADNIAFLARMSAFNGVCV